MKKFAFCIFLLMNLFCMHVHAVQLNSVYTLRPDDPEAFYFTPDNYPGITTDGRTDVSAQLQQAINDLKKTRNFGILFIPEGTYTISRTIYIPPAIRLIGYGNKRPEFVLAPNSPGFQQEVPDDKGKAAYMFWFTGNMVEPGGTPYDANAGTFYSAMSNINLRIADGNPHAVALRTHFAQHCFINFVSINIGNGKAGLFDIGNELESVAFFGGEYGIYTTKSSPGWPVMMVDAYFEGQRTAALRCQESGLAMVNLQVKNVPVVFDIDRNYCDKLFVENGRFENVTDAAVVIANENNSNNQITFRNIDCNRVPVIARYIRSNTETTASTDRIYRIASYDHGLQMDSLTAEAEYATTVSIEPLKSLPAPIVTDIPALPAMKEWVNLRSLGAVGNGETDDTDAIQSALDKFDVIYVPQGWYRITRPLKMRPENKLIGLHPFGTQLQLAESTPQFSGFGAPQPMLQSAPGSDNILNGIGINTGAYNYRAVGVKWLAGEKSYLNDVKFVGGHGGMWKPRPGEKEPSGWWQRERKISTPYEPVTDPGMDQAWDNQYWSLWVTDEGGGTFKDIWSASSYATSGFYASRTSTPSRIYAMSVEHHVRNEVRFNRVANWKIYCLQTEEESRESMDCQPIEMDDCSNMTFTNLYMFRVIRIDRPYHSSIRIRNCHDITFLNLHNYSQIKYTNNVAVYDAGKDIDLRPWELSRLVITGSEQRPEPLSSEVGTVNRIASDFEFAEGITADSRGNIYFCDSRMRRVYRYDPANDRLTLLADFPWRPSNIAVDTDDNVLVLFRYEAQPGYLIDGKPEQLPRTPDTRGTSFSGYGNSGFTMAMYSIDPDNPEETITSLPRIPMTDVTSVAKALYPSNRWRDFHDFNEVTLYRPEMCFLAPDGQTVIPHFFDLARCSQLLEAIPGRPFYTSDEYDRRMVRTEVAGDGTLSDLTYFVEQGEFGSTVDADGNIYVADGDIYVFNPKGERINKIRTPERPSTLHFGADGSTLYFTGRSGLYGVKVK